LGNPTKEEQLKTEIDEMLDLVALWLNCTDDIDRVLLDYYDDPDGDVCCVPCQFGGPCADIPF
jgi:hypothetical protein